jgi:hypothetical protein
MSKPLPSPAQILQPCSSTQDELDALLLDASGYMKLLPSEEILQYPHEQLRCWCHRHSRFTLVTSELIDWLKQQIGSQHTIEIAAGKGDICYHLGIRGTDSYAQLAHDDYFRATGQIPVVPHPNIEKREAVQAVKKYKPKVVVASWATQRYVVDKHLGISYGIDEQKILDLVKTYIHIGNDNSHNAKPILKRSHTKHRFPWLITRAAEPQKNAIWIFKKVF